MTRLRLGVSLVLAFLLLVPATAWAQFGGAQEQVTWSATVDPAEAAPGQDVTLTLSASIDGDWKMYALDSPPPSRGVRVMIDSIGGGLAKAGETQQNEPSRGYDPNFQKEVTYFASEAGLRVPFTVRSDAASGAASIHGQVEYMVCNDQMCLPPTRTSFQTVVQINGNAPAASTSEPATSEPAIPESDVLSSKTTSEAAEETSGETSGETSEEASEEASEEKPESADAPVDSPVDAESETTPSTDRADFEGPVASVTGDLDVARTDGLLGFLLLAIGAGAAALLTPCVFPMIPLTVSFFTKHTDDRAQAVRMAGLYGTSIVLTFTGLGVAMALLLGAAGAQTIAANPWVNLFIGSVFVVFALSLLGMFELRLPNGLVNYFNQRSTESGGVMGVVFMGLTLTMVSFSCTAPFVGGLLAATAGGEWFFPIVGMLAFSATFALPFVGFALFPNALDRLPKSGSWMNVVKVTLGFVELAAALKFLSNADLIWGAQLLTRPLAIALTVVIFFLAGLYLLGKLRLKHEPAVESIGSGRLLASMVFFGTALYMLPGLMGAPLGSLDAYLPPRQASDVSLMTTRSGDTGESEFDWVVDDLDAAFARAEQTGKPLFIDFTGYTCTNCRDMEANVFPQPPVAEQLRRDFVLLRLYTDDLPDGTTYQRYQLRLTGTTALPTYAIVDPKDRSLISKTSGVASVDEFAGFLARGVSVFQNQAIAER